MTQMYFVIVNLLIAIALFIAMLTAQQWGRRLGERHLKRAPQIDGRSSRAAEGAVFGLLGLFLAFTFSDAGSRFDLRRHLVAREANAIGTAWLRIDVLPAQSRPQLRALVRDYLDARLEVYRLVSKGNPFDAAMRRSVLLQQQIWSAATHATVQSGQLPGYTVLLPALNDMIDITTTRSAAARQHAPAVVYAMIGFLAVVSSAFVGYEMAGRVVRSAMHTVGFAAVMSIVLYVIIDLDFPRLGLVRVDAADRVLIELRQSMN